MCAVGSQSLVKISGSQKELKERAVYCSQYTIFVDVVLVYVVNIVAAVCVVFVVAHVIAVPALSIPFF